MYYVVNGKVFKAEDLDAKRKAMFEARGIFPKTKEEL